MGANCESQAARIDFNQNFLWAHGPRWQQADILLQNGIVFAWDEIAVRYVSTDRKIDGIEWRQK